MASLASIAPSFSVQDPRGTAQWYRDRLGFEWAEIYGPAPHHNFFAIVWRGEVRIMLRFTRDGPGARPWVPKVDQPLFDAYLDSDDVDALRQDFIANGLEVGARVDRIYGTREITVTDPNGYVLIFGQDVAPSQLPSISLRGR